MPGGSKLARPWRGGTVLDAVVAAAARAALSPLVVVVSARFPGDPGPGVNVVRTPTSGRADSLAAGLAECPPGPVVVLLGDEPAIDAEVIRELRRGAAEAGLDLARVKYSDREGHPVWIAAKARENACFLRGDESVWERLLAGAAHPGRIAVPRPAPIDVDSPEAFRRARQAAFGRGGDA